MNLCCRRETCRTTSLNGLRLILDKSGFDLRILWLIFIILLFGTINSLWLRVSPSINDFSPVLTRLTAKLPSQLWILLMSQRIIFSDLLILSPITGRHYLSVFCNLLIAIIFTIIRINIQGLLLDILHLIFCEIVTLVDPIVRRFTTLLTLVSINLLLALHLNLVISRTTQMPLVVSSLSLWRHLVAVLSRIRG